MKHLKNVSNDQQGHPEMRYNMTAYNFKMFITVDEASLLLGVSKSTVRNWADDGFIPTYRHPKNNYRLFKRDEINEVLWKIQQEKKQ